MTNDQMIILIQEATLENDRLAIARKRREIGRLQEDLAIMEQAYLKRTADLDEFRREWLKRSVV